MRYLILSDIHSNIEALEAVLATAEGHYAQVICCGDVVGYGPDPNAVTEWVRANAAVVVRGNHDKACVGLTDAEEFTDTAKVAAFWTREQLSAENRDYLFHLPKGPIEIAEDFEIVHGSPRDEDEYVPGRWASVGAFSLLKRTLAFFGHTHIQGGFICNGRRIIDAPQLKHAGNDNESGIGIRGVLDLQPGRIYYLNPGSVGQPRDQDRRAAFCIYDNSSGLVEFGRAAYDIESTIGKIQAFGLPEFLGSRLRFGK